jgi:hypothetical protein
MFSHPSIAKKIILPKVLHKQKNGLLPSKILVNTFDSSLLKCAFNAWGAFCHYASSIADIYLGGIDFYRTLDQQTELQLYRSTELATPSDGIPRAFDIAEAGLSSHGWGLAIDLGLLHGEYISPSNLTLLQEVDSDEWKWVAKNLEQFGFGFEDPEQPWHIVYKTGDQVPKKVKFFTDSIRWNTINLRKGRFAKFTFNGVRPTLQFGYNNNSTSVTYLQSIIFYNKRFSSSRQVQMTGVYDRKTEDAVKSLQNHYGLEETGIVDSETWHAVNFEGFNMVKRNIWPLEKSSPRDPTSTDPVSLKLPLSQPSTRPAPTNWVDVDWTDISDIHATSFVDSYQHIYNAYRMLRDHPNMWATKKQVWGSRHNYSYSTENGNRPSGIYREFTVGHPQSTYAKIHYPQYVKYPRTFVYPSLINFLYISMELGWIWDKFAGACGQQDIRDRTQWQKTYGTPHEAGTAIDFMCLGHVDYGGAFYWTTRPGEAHDAYVDLVQRLDAFINTLPYDLKPGFVSGPFQYGNIAQDRKPTHMHIDVSDYHIPNYYQKVGKLLPELKVPYDG